MNLRYLALRLVLKSVAQEFPRVDVMFTLLYLWQIVFKNFSASQ
ncbi:MAG: hypothetical protein V4642_05945 [Bacteroidota bacterium]